MDAVNLGSTGVKVSPFCLGAMNFGGRTDLDEARRIVQAALDGGVNFIDTANVYNAGRSESILGEILSQDNLRERFVLATKVHGAMGEGPNERGNSRRHIMLQCEASLKRLRTDWIDLYQIHRPDPSTPIEETLRALDDLVHAGKIRYFGLSTYPAWETVHALWTSDRLGLNRFVTEQPPYHLFNRQIENEVLPMCRKFGIGVIPWSPLASGVLTGKYRKGKPAPAGTRGEAWKWDLTNDTFTRRLDVVESLIAYLEQNRPGVSLTHFALAWCRRDPVITAPILGPATAEQLRDCLGAWEVKITPEDEKFVDGLVPPGTKIS